MPARGTNGKGTTYSRTTTPTYRAQLQPLRAIIRCDLHTRYQQIAMLNMETSEEVERRLEHENGEARAFYNALQGPVRVGIEATGHTHWFEAMLAELGHELWMGDAAKIRASVVRLAPASAPRSRPSPYPARKLVASWDENHIQ